MQYQTQRMNITGNTGSHIDITVVRQLLTALGYVCMSNVITSFCYQSVAKWLFTAVIYSLVNIGRWFAMGKRNASGSLIFMCMAQKKLQLPLWRPVNYGLYVVSCTCNLFEYYLRPVWLVDVCFTLILGSTVITYLIWAANRCKHKRSKQRLYVFLKQGLVLALVVITLNNLGQPGVTCMICYVYFTEGRSAGRPTPGSISST